MEIRLAYSPDADDAFMFRAAIEGLIDTEGLQFVPITADTQSLNAQASRGDIDVTAISVAAWPGVAENFLLLPHGGSIGRGYGPVIVSGVPHAVDDLNEMTIATPGSQTTAHLLASAIAPNAQFTRVPISPYEAIFSAIESGDVDAGIIIHEGRLTYESHGSHKIVDLGEWWLSETGLPLPLGANVVRRSLGVVNINRVSRVLQRSIGWALEHRNEMIRFLLDDINRPDEIASHDLLDRYLGMYANEDTYEYRPDVRKGIEKILEFGLKHGFYSERPIVEFA